MPQPDNGDSYPYSFDHPTPPRKRRNTEEDQSVKEDVLEEIDDAFGISNRLLGCGWWLILLPVRLIAKIFGFIGDLFD